MELTFLESVTKTFSLALIEFRMDSHRQLFLVDLFMIPQKERTMHLRSVYDTHIAAVLETDFGI